MITLIERGAIHATSLAVAALIGLLLVDGTAQLSAQGLPDPPQFIYGSVQEIQVGGEPYDGVTPIEILSGAGDVLGTAVITDDGLWSFQVKDGIEEFRIRIGETVTESFPFSSGALTPIVIETGDAAPEAVFRRVELGEGFQALTHSGADVSLEEFLAMFGNAEAVSGIFVWDGEVSNWAAWRRALPASLQAVTTINNGTGMLLLLTAATTYESEVIARESVELPIGTGFTALGFLGVNGIAPAAALQLFSATEAVAALYRFNNETQSYDSFRPVLPESLNTLQDLSRWDLLIIQSDASGVWPFDSFEPE